MRKRTLFVRILAAMLAVSLLPLLVSSGILFLNLRRTSTTLANRIALTEDRQASEALQVRAQEIADAITRYLRECEEDLQLASSLPRDPATIEAFYESRKGEIWTRRGTPAAPREDREWVPRYSSIAYIDARGNETLVVRDGRLVPRRELRNVADPAATEFRNEEYFRRASRLRAGEIYVSHVTGFHVSRDEQLNGAADPESAFAGRSYLGVIRFAAPHFTRGRLDGVVVLSLDHRHLMEFTQHVLPGKERQIVFPSYRSGNYAFLFDDDGWIITHPKFWDIRGVDSEGKLVRPYSADSAAADVASGRIPFNLDKAGFIDANYPVVAQRVRERKSGFVDITNVGGSRKIMAFAPILYDSGPYARSGIFGGVTIGFQTESLHDYARAGARAIDQQIHKHVRESAVIIFLTALIAACAAWFISRGVTRPVALLAREARKLAEGGTGQRVEVPTRDELGELAADFNVMAEELELRKNNLLQAMQQLESSRHEITDERNFKESVLQSISSAILTFSPEGRLTSVNATGKNLLGTQAGLGASFASVLNGIEDMPQRVAAVLAGERPYGREQLWVGRGGEALYFEVGFFPIGSGADRGITVTMRNETEKERMREEVTRLDRLASLGRLSAGIAHEIRNPLTGITLLLDDLHDRASDPDNQDMMRRALHEIERVERLIAALLNYSSPPKTEFREADLERVISDLLILLRRQCAQQKVEVVRTEAPLPLFSFDPEKIRQALLNIFRNAVEALPGGGEVSIATAIDGGNAVISVSDTGPGVSPADLPYLFEPFFTRKGAGTGLGLSITHRIVDEHGGSIHVDSVTGNGTTFTILLPLVR